MDGWSYPTINMEEVEKWEEEFSNLPLIYKVIFLRDKMKWSWRRITKFLYPNLKGERFEKTMLKLHGNYLKTKRKLNKGVITFSVITPPDLENLIDERDYLIKMLSIMRDEEKRKDIYRKLNFVKSLILLYLIVWRFGLEKEFGKVYGVYSKLKDRVDWGKDHVKMSGGKTIEWCSNEISSLIIVSTVVGIGISPKIKEMIEFLTNGNEKKKKRILRIIMEKFGDVVTQSILLPFFS
ncbi:MAG: hypothetical protein QW607_01925 [Desulfurococcaceae archaeon]